MHGIETINKVNREQFIQAAEKLRDQGRYVVATYDGLHCVGFESFSDREEAFTKFAQEQNGATPSQHFKLLLPPDANGAKVEIEADRPQLLDNPPDDPVLEDQPELTTEEEGALMVAINQRDLAQTALLGAAMAFAKAQDECTRLANDLREKMEARGRQMSLIN